MLRFLSRGWLCSKRVMCGQVAGTRLGGLIMNTSSSARRASGPTRPPLTPPAGAVWDTGRLTLIDFTFPGSDISAMTYLGAMAPDVCYFLGDYFRKRIGGDRQGYRSPSQSTASDPISWADLLHYNRSGDVLLTFLEHIAYIPSPALSSHAMAFSMSYLSHIATDIALNPCINALASAYNADAVAGIFSHLSMHFYVELCLDEYIADRYFKRPLYTWLGQPWVRYIEPVAAQCAISQSIPSRVLELLTNAAEIAYELTETQSQTFHQDYLVGIQRLRKYLAGSGPFRLFTLQALNRKRSKAPILASIAALSSKPVTVNFEQVISYAIHVREYLCGQAISYYASLRNTPPPPSAPNHL